MSDGWLQRTKDGTLWRVNNSDAYAAALKGGLFVACEAPEIVPTYPTEPVGVTPEQQAVRAAHLAEAEERYEQDAGWGRSPTGRVPIPQQLRERTTTTDVPDEESTDQTAGERETTT